MAQPILRLAPEAPTSVTTAAQRSALSSAKAALNRIERCGCGSFTTPEGQAQARLAAADLEAAAKQLRAALR